MFTSVHIGNGRVVASAIILYVILVLFERGKQRVALKQIKESESVKILFQTSTFEQLTVDSHSRPTKSLNN